MVQCADFVVWYGIGVVWCGTYGVMCGGCIALLCGVMRYGVVLYNMLFCGVV